MEKQEIINEYKKELDNIYCLIRLLRAYCIDKSHDIDTETTMVPTLNIILEKIDNSKKLLYKLKND